MNAQTEEYMQVEEMRQFAATYDSRYFRTHVKFIHNHPDLDAEAPVDIAQFVNDFKRFMKSLYKLARESHVIYTSSTYFTEIVSVFLQMKTLLWNIDPATKRGLPYSIKALYFRACCVLDIYPHHDSLYDTNGSFVIINELEADLAKRGVIKFASPKMADFVMNKMSTIYEPYSAVVSESLPVNELHELAHNIQQFSRKLGGSLKHNNLYNQIVPKARLFI